MSTPFIAEIQIFAFDFPPRGWAQCNGQFLPINQNQALFSLLGTQFGGNGQTTFALPDLRGRTPVDWGTLPGGGTFGIGQSGGEENHTLIASEMPAHNHVMQASTNNADLPNANGNLLSKGGSEALYSTSQNGSVMASNAIANGGSSQSHPNTQPYLVVNFCIALQGVFPSRN